MKLIYNKEYEAKSLRFISAIGASLLLLASIGSTVDGSEVVDTDSVSRTIHVSGAEVLSFEPELKAFRHRYGESNDVVASVMVESEDIVTEVEQEVTVEVECTLPLIFNALDVTQCSNMTLEQLKAFVARYCPEWVGLEEQILELDSRINLIFLLSVARCETGAGENVVGAFNCFNTKDFYTGDYVDYSTHYESIVHFCDLIEYDYVSPDGLWYGGDSSLATIATTYASEAWGDGILELADEIIWKFETGSLQPVE